MACSPPNSINLSQASGDQSISGCGRYSGVASESPPKHRVFSLKTSTHLRRAPVPNTDLAFLKRPSKSGDFEHRPSHASDWANHQPQEGLLLQQAASHLGMKSALEVSLKREYKIRSIVLGTPSRANKVITMIRTTNCNMFSLYHAHLK